MAERIKGKARDRGGRVMDCMKCRYSMIATDDAYGATIRWVEGCKLTESGKPCPYRREVNATTEEDET